VGRILRARQMDGSTVTRQAESVPCEEATHQKTTGDRRTGLPVRAGPSANQLGPWPAYHVAAPAAHGPEQVTAAGRPASGVRETADVMITIRGASDT
jgi:hypothetical protein